MALDLNSDKPENTTIKTGTIRDFVENKTPIDDEQKSTGTSDSLVTRTAKEAAEIQSVATSNVVVSLNKGFEEQAEHNQIVQKNLENPNPPKGFDELNTTVRKIYDILFRHFEVSRTKFQGIDGAGAGGAGIGGAGDASGESKEATGLGDLLSGLLGAGAGAATARRGGGRGGPGGPTPPANQSRSRRVWESVKSKIRGNKKTALLLAGAATLGGIFAFSDDDEEEEKRYFEERVEAMNREQRDQPELKGEELIAFRASITESHGKIPDPNTGYPIDAVKEYAIRYGLVDFDTALNTDNNELYELLKAHTAGTDLRLPAKPEQGFFSSAYDKIVEFVSPTNLALGGGATLASAAILRSRIQPPSTDATIRSVDQVLADNRNDLTNVRENAERTARLATERGNQAQPPRALKNVLHEAASPTTTRNTLKRVPIVGTALAGYEAATILTDDKLSTSEKAGELADLGGGIAGGVVGAKGGAALGAALGTLIAPGIGTAIIGTVGGIMGGVAGFFGGEALVEGLRTSVFGPSTPEVKPASRAQPEPPRPILDNYPSYKTTTSVVGGTKPLEQGKDNIDTYLKATAKVESGGRRNAVSDTGATGLYQFTMGTWNDLTEKHADKIRAMGVEPVKITRANKGTPDDPRLDEKRQHVYARILTENNAKSIGTDRPGALYLAHFLGPASARAIMDAINSGNGDALAMSVLPSSVRPQITRSQTNRSIVMGKSANDLMLWAEAKLAKNGADPLLRSTPGEYVPGTVKPSGAATGAAVNGTSAMPTAPGSFNSAEDFAAYQAQFDVDKFMSGTGLASTNSISLINGSAYSTVPSNGDITGATPVTSPPNMPKLTPEMLNSGRSFDLTSSLNQPMALSRPTEILNQTADQFTNQLQNRVSEFSRPVSNFAAQPTQNFDFGVQSPVSTQQVPQATSSFSSLSSQAINEDTTQRLPYESVKKVMMLEQPVAPAKKSVAGGERIPTSGTYESNSVRPTIEDTPIVVSDFGLVLLNAGLI